MLKYVGLIKARDLDLIGNHDGFPDTMFYRSTLLSSSGAAEEWIARTKKDLFDFPEFNYEITSTTLAFDESKSKNFDVFLDKSFNIWP